ncbi:MAG: hypothetical protein GXN99_01040 [Candidatus Nanohaloarchaeota archaeon]|nr:hypothetical protein [Candidatus Nanohaloarchaeota archaeon]
MYRALKKSIPYAYVGYVGLFIFGIMLVSYVFADTAYDIITIKVNVSQVSLVDINPSLLSWQNVPPGGVGNAALEENNYEAVWIENIGSTNITAIWFNSSYPDALPFGTGNPNAYDAGNFVVISDGVTNYYFVNRVEYIENDSLYVRTHADINATSYLTGNIFGRFRNSSYEYFWEFNTLAGGQNCTYGNFYISTAPKTKSSTGDADLTDNSAILITPVRKLLDLYGVGVVDVNGTATYCVVIPEDCSYVMFNRWNADAPGADSVCATAINAGYFVNGTYIYPGGVAKAYIQVYVPYGVTYGPVGEGKLTVFVTTS